MSKGQVRRIGLPGVMAYPAVSAALVVALALALTPFGTPQVMALEAPPTPTETMAPSPATTSVPSPTTTNVPSPTTTNVPNSNPTPSPAPIPSLDSVLNPAPGAFLAPVGLSVDHHVMARVEGPGLAAVYLPVDDTVLDASQLQTFRVRFQMRNAGSDPITATPQLEYRPSGGAAYVAIPEKPELGAPFHTSREWVPGTEGGTIQGPLDEDIPVAELLTTGKLGETSVDGHRSMSANPDKPITLPPASYSEQEFTVTLSIDAKYLTGYDLRITDGGTPLPGTTATMIRLGTSPAVQLSPGQRQGATVLDPGATSPSGAAYALLPAPTTATGETSATLAAVSPTSTAAYPLASGSLSPAVAAVDIPAGVDIPVVESSNMHGQCAACHRGHTAKAPDLTKESQQSTLCFSCHNSSGGAVGTGAKDIKSQYTLQPLALANNPEKREYYSHDAISSTPSTTRPSGCADCHNSHKAGTTDSTQTSDGTGWTASGRLAGVSGVSVLNGLTPGSAPTYTSLDGVTDLVTREYQLCFKCHSGATTLTSNAGLKPSQYALDKGMEFNPANESFHPVEAEGKNQSDAMKRSLAGTSPYKRWNFTTKSTVRCLNCHAGGATPDATAPPTDAATAGDSLPPHTSSNRGILLENYRDRVLKSRGAAYSAGDFALCYVCHGEEPFRNNSSTATNFPAHALHLTDLSGEGDGGTDIDKAGDGRGNALCAECHFRIHSTTNKVGAQKIPGSRLVNFAPNVQPASGTISWTPGATRGGSCTLTCHGESHDSYDYDD